jgi:hypothetical protein
VQDCINTVDFSPLQVKNKPSEEVMNVRLFLGLLAWLRTGLLLGNINKSLRANEGMRQL